MASQNSRSLRALVVFRNILHPEMIRTVHMYRLGEGKEENEEREYVLYEESNYIETGMGRVFTAYSNNFNLSEQKPGETNGVWKCIFVFDADDGHCNLDDIPDILSISRNPRLESLPSLANDLQVINQKAHEVNSNDAPTAAGKERESVHADKLAIASRVLDLNVIPISDSDDEDFADLQYG